MYQDVAAFADLPDRGGVVVVVEGQPVLLVRSQDQVFATAGLCSHEELPLEGGTLTGSTTWECPHHGGALDLGTGRPVRMPVCASVETYPVRVEGGRVLVEID
jgi:3-phenylpropionate/trans-cinnamate dioxygenase ferredoxin subunit